MSVTETPVIDNPFEDAQPSDETPTQLTEAEARAMGFSEEDLAILVEAGVLVEEHRREAWEPSTLADVAWLIRKRKLIRFEISERQRWHEEAVARLQRAEQALSRWDEICAQITRENLPRKKDGSYAAKSIPIEGALVKLTAQKGGPKVVDEQAVLSYILSGGECCVALAEAVKVSVTETFEGPAALEVLQDPAYAELAKPKVLHQPVRDFVAGLPPLTKEETGEVLGPASIPGVEIVEPSERWSWE
ncbi:MAG: hypothetical protein ACK47B_23630 [Armatimonadota bacterium]